jgi:hypothetical protein
MDWFPTQLDPLAIFAWCALTGNIGRPVMAIVGLGGLIIAIGKLWTLPPPLESNIITVQNKRRRYRTGTLVVGWIASILFAVSIPLYFYATAKSKVCEETEVSHAAAVAVFPFLTVTLFALCFFLWFQARTHKSKAI